MQTTLTHRSQNSLLQAPSFNHSTVVEGKAAVCTQLSELVQSRQVLSIWQRRTNTYFFATLVAFDPMKELIYFERGSEGISRNVNLAEDFTCYAKLNHETIQFTLNGLLQDQFLGTPAWIANLPAYLLNNQQREYARTGIPITKPSFCKIKGINGYACPREIRVQLVDISHGGIGFVAPLIVCGLFSPNSQFDDCELQIHGEEPVKISLKVRTSQTVSSKSGIKAVRIGAEITAIHHQSEYLLEAAASHLNTTEEPTLSGFWGKTPANRQSPSAMAR